MCFHASCGQKLDFKRSDVKFETGVSCFLRCLSIDQGRCGGCVFVADEADPVSGERVGECIVDGFAAFGGEGLVIDPGAVAVDVDLSGDMQVVFLRIVAAEFEGFFVVTGDEVGIGGFAGFDFGLVPRAALAAGFAEFPDVVDGTGPERGLAVGGAEDVRVVLRGVLGDAAHDEQAAVGTEVVYEAVVGADGADF